MTTGIELVTRKVNKNRIRFAPYNNGPYHADGQLKNAAIFTMTGDLNFYPRDWDTWYRDKCITETDEVEELVNACALLIAEIDRLNHKP